MTNVTWKSTFENLLRDSEIGQAIPEVAVRQYRRTLWPCETCSNFRMKKTNLLIIGELAKGPSMEDSTSIPHWEIDLIRGNGLSSILFPQTPFFRSLTSHSSLTSSWTWSPARGGSRRRGWTWLAELISIFWRHSLFLTRTGKVSAQPTRFSTNSKILPRRKTLLLQTFNCFLRGTTSRRMGNSSIVNSCTPCPPWPPTIRRCWTRGSLRTPWANQSCPFKFSTGRHSIRWFMPFRWYLTPSLTLSACDTVALKSQDFAYRMCTKQYFIRVSRLPKLVKCFRSMILKILL